MTNFYLRYHPFKMSACSRGGGVKNLPNLPTDSTKKCQQQGGRDQKFVKICRRLKWMVPKKMKLKWKKSDMVFTMKTWQKGILQRICLFCLFCVNLRGTVNKEKQHVNCKDTKTELEESLSLQKQPSSKPFLCILLLPLKASQRSQKNIFSSHPSSDL